MPVRNPTGNPWNPTVSRAPCLIHDMANPKQTQPNRIQPKANPIQTQIQASPNQTESDPKETHMEPNPDPSDPKPNRIQPKANRSQPKANTNRTKKRNPNRSQIKPNPIQSEPKVKPNPTPSEPKANPSQSKPNGHICRMFILPSGDDPCRSNVDTIYSPQSHSDKKQSCLLPLPPKMQSWGADFSCDLVCSAHPVPNIAFWGGGGSCHDWGE